MPEITTSVFERNSDEGRNLDRDYKHWVQNKYNFREDKKEFRTRTEKGYQRKVVYAKKKNNPERERKQDID